MRVALVCPYSWSFRGGVKTHIVGLAAALGPLGVESEIIAPLEAEDDPPRDVIGVGGTMAIRSNGSVGRVTLSPAAAARTEHLVRTRGYDLVHVHEPIVPVVGLAAVRGARVPVVGTFHRHSAGRGWYGPFAPLCRWGAGRLTARIAVSEAAREYVARTAPGDYVVIPNGIDARALLPPHERRGDRRILFVGRPEPRKGLQVLLAALERLPDARLDIVGATATELARLHPVLPASVGVRVRAHGVVDDARRRDLAGECDLLCAPSIEGESFGLVLVEGMAAGLPVVASAIPGYSEVVPESCGRLVPPGDPGALAEALGTLLGDAERRRALGAAGRRWAQRFDWSRVAAQIVGVYRQALAGAGADGVATAAADEDVAERLHGAS